MPYAGVTQYDRPAANPAAATSTRSAQTMVLRNSVYVSSVSSQTTASESPCEAAWAFNWLQIDIFAPLRFRRYFQAQNCDLVLPCASIMKSNTIGVAFSEASLCAVVVKIKDPRYRTLPSGLKLPVPIAFHVAISPDGVA